MCRQHSETLQKFLAATAKGYEFAAQHPEEAAELLCQTASDTALDKEMVKESMQMLSQVTSTSHHVHQQVQQGSRNCLMQSLFSNTIFTVIYVHRRTQSMHGIAVHAQAFRVFRRHKACLLAYCVL